MDGDNKGNVPVENSGMTLAQAIFYIAGLVIIGGIVIGAALKYGL